eukprot:648978-Pyramimonas_sp.AAC.1
MVQDAYQAGAPAGGSDGSWIQARCADVTGIASSGITPTDTLYANDPWRAQVQQLPVPAGQPASFAPMSRAATPFGTPQSAGSTNSLQGRFQTFEWTRSSIRLYRRHRHMHRRVHLRGNLLFLIIMLYKGLKVLFVSKSGCTGRS